MVSQGWIRGLGLEVDASVCLFEVQEPLRAGAKRSFGRGPERATGTLAVGVSAYGFAWLLHSCQWEG